MPPSPVDKDLNVRISVHEPSGKNSMGHVSYTELRQHLAKYLDRVCDDRTPLIVTRQNERSVVMMSLAEFESIEETLHLLRSPANAEQLLRSMADADAGKLSEHNIEE